MGVVAIRQRGNVAPTSRDFKSCVNHSMFEEIGVFVDFARLIVCVSAKMLVFASSSCCKKVHMSFVFVFCYTVFMF